MAKDFTTRLQVAAEEVSVKVRSSSCVIYGRPPIGDTASKPISIFMQPKSTQPACPTLP